jgi:hypothetical protein
MGTAIIALLLLSACQRSDRKEPHARGETGVSSEGPDSSASPAAAAQVIRDYYNAIEDHRYREAYDLWESGGTASGKSFVAFLNGWAQVIGIEATTGAPGPIGAAAGSRYVDVPVRVVAKIRGGATEVTTGSYRLRRTVVDGATPDQRQWRIYSASLSGPGEAGNRT